MIKFKFLRNEKDAVMGFECSGHAGYSVHGKDIVCASVSILVINTVNSIDKFTSDKGDEFADPEKGLIRFEFKDEPSKDSKLLMRSMYLGLQFIQKQYGKQYITIEK